ncbi:Mediator of RNA polymerase II transcription subunit 13 [Bienertia sinuspersici]
MYVPSSNISWYWRQLTHIEDKFRAGYSGNKWLFNKKGYSTSNGYAWLRQNQDDVEWANWVWNRLNIRKHRLLSWIIMWGCLQTRDRLRKMGLQVEETCPLCGLHSETADNVLIQCSYAKNYRQDLNSILQMCHQVSDLISLSYWLNKPVTGQFRSKVIQCSHTTLLYNIWM